MPYRRRTFKPKGKRSGRRKRSYGYRKAKYAGTARNSPAYRGGKIPLFPRRMFTTFKYGEDFTLTNAAANLPVSYAFRANSMFDPNLTGLGAQPRYYDTLLGADGGSAPYGRYVVLAAKITATVFARSDSVLNNKLWNAWFSIRALHTNSAPTSKEEMMEGTFMKRMPICNNQTGMPRRLTFYIPLKKLYGCKDVTDDLNNYGAGYNGNPAESATFICSMCPQGSGDVGASFDVMVRIKYYCMLYAPNAVASS